MRAESLLPPPPCFSPQPCYSSWGLFWITNYIGRNVAGETQVELQALRLRFSAALENLPPLAYSDLAAIKAQTHRLATKSLVWPSSVMQDLPQGQRSQIHLFLEHPLLIHTWSTGEASNTAYTNPELAQLCQSDGSNRG